MVRLGGFLSNLLKIYMSIWETRIYVFEFVPVFPLLALNFSINDIFVSIDTDMAMIRHLDIFSNHYFIFQGIHRRLKNSWTKGVSSSRRIQLDSKFIAIKVDSTSLAVGLEDGSIEYWQRIGHTNTQLYRTQPFKKWGPCSGHKDFVRVIDLSPSFILSGSRDATIR